MVDLRTFLNRNRAYVDITQCAEIPSGEYENVPTSISFSVIGSTTTAMYDNDFAGEVADYFSGTSIWHCPTNPRAFPFQFVQTLFSYFRILSLSFCLKFIYRLMTRSLPLQLLFSSFYFQYSFRSLHFNTYLYVRHLHLHDLCISVSRYSSLDLLNPDFLRAIT